MTGAHDGRGILYPARLPTFHREPPPERLGDLVRWFWIPRWQLEPGRVSRQRVLPFPASNLVIEPDGTTLTGPATGASHRDLRGTGWAVGALLRPAGLATLHCDPSQLKDTELTVVEHDVADLHRRVAAAMADPDETVGRQRTVEAFASWASTHLEPPDEPAALANTMEDLIASDSAIVRVDQLARRLNLSVRGVQRLARRYIGLPPLAVIRRYRLQEAAQRLREDPSLTVSQVAAELAYADHSHLSTDFRTVLGLTPSAYQTTSR